MSGVLAEPSRVHDLIPWRGPVEVGWQIPAPDGGFGPPQSIIDLIHTFWEPYVPLVCTRVFVGPDGHKYEFRYHVIGMWRNTPDGTYPDFGRIVNVERPSKFPFKGGVIYEQATISAPWPDDSPQRGCLTPDIPLAYPDMPLPKDILAYDWIKEPPTKMDWDRTAAWIQRCIHFTLHVAGTINSKLDELEAKRREASAAEGQKIDAEADYKFKQLRSVYKRAVDEGRFLPIPRPYQPKPYVFVRRNRGAFEV